RGTQMVPGIGLLVLNTTSTNALNLTTSGNVTVTNGSVVVDSSSSSGLHLGAAGNLTATLIKTSTTSSPGYSTTSSGTISGTIKYNQPITPDPLATFATNNVPSTTGMSNFGSVTVSTVPAVGTNLMSGGQVYGTVTATNQITLNPGYYSGNFTVNHITN